jgi:hypothetical protein
MSLKSIQATLLIILFIATSLSISSAAALSQDQAQIHNFFQPSILIPGQSVSASVFFVSNISDTLTLTSVGYHFDWMGTGNFVGADLSSQPITVAANGTQSIGTLSITIPSNVTLGDHTFYIEIEGYQGSSPSNTFTWDSPSLSVAVIGSNGQTGNPTITSQPTNGGNPSGPDLQLYGAVAAVIIIVVLLAIVIVLRQKRAESKTASSEAPKETPSPEQKPEEKPSSTEDFDI